MSADECCSRFPANFCDDGERLPGDPRWKPSRRGFATSCCRYGYALRVVDVGLSSHLLYVDVECEGAAARKRLWYCKSCSNLARSVDCDDLVCSKCGETDWSPRTEQYGDPYLARAVPR